MSEYKKNDFHKNFVHGEVKSILDTIHDLRVHKAKLQKPFDMLKKELDVVDEKIKSYEQYYEESEANHKFLNKGEEPSIHWGELSNIEILKDKDDTP